MSKEIPFEQTNNNGEAPQGVLASQVEAGISYGKAAKIGFALVGGGGLLISAGCIRDLKDVQSSSRYAHSKSTPAKPIGEAIAGSGNNIVFGQSQSTPDVENVELFPCDPNAAKQDNCIPVNSSDVGGNN